MNATSPASLDSATLALRLAELAGDEREVQVEFLRHLAEYAERRAYLDAGFGSLWDYVTEGLHYAEGAAFRRIRAMRVLRRFPSLAAPLRDGRLGLTTVGMLEPIITDDNVEELVAQAAFKSKSEVEQLVVSRQQRPAPKDGIRKLPARAEELVPARSVLTQPEPDAEVPASAPPAPQPVREARRSTIEPVAEDTFSARITFTKEMKADLETLRSLLSHKIPNGELAAVVHEALRCAIEKHGKRKGAI